MDVKKTGEFIAMKRREANLTQRDLAERLDISVNAVSNWERGKNMPDVSLFAPLCGILGISVNELLEGEAIPAEKALSRADTSIISTMRSAKNQKRRFLIILIAVVIFFSAVALAFGIDVYRMRKNKPVVFSTWGIDYVPENFGDETDALLAVKGYVSDRMVKENAYFLNERTFCEVYPLCGMQEKYGMYELYVWVAAESYATIDDEYVCLEGFSAAAKYILKKDGGRFTVISESFPKDGGMYERSLKMLFPKKAQKTIERIQKDGTVEYMLGEIGFRAEKAAKMYGCTLN